jgi:hypothetical protein
MLATGQCLRPRLKGLGVPRRGRCGPRTAAASACVFGTDRRGLLRRPLLQQVRRCRRRSHHPRAPARRQDRGREYDGHATKRGEGRSIQQHLGEPVFRLLPTCHWPTYPFDGLMRQSNNGTWCFHGSEGRVPRAARTRRTVHRNASSSCAVRSSPISRRATRWSPSSSKGTDSAPATFSVPPFTSTATRTCLSRTSTSTSGTSASLMRSSSSRYARCRMCNTVP